MSIEAMKQMVEALEAYQHNGSVQLFDEAITTGRQAIAEAEKQEPVAWKTDDIELYVREDKFGFYNIPLYTRPQPKREWVGLTEPQRVEIAGGELTRDERMIAIAIEAELKKLNT